MNLYFDNGNKYFKRNKIFFARFILFLTRTYILNGLFPTYGHTDLPPSSEVSPLKNWLWMVRSVLNRMGKIIKKFSNFYFSSYHRKLGWFFQKNDTKMTIARKIKIRKLVFLSIQPVSEIPCKLKKNNLKFWNLFEKCSRRKKIIILIIIFASFFCSYVVSVCSSLRSR